MWSAFERVAAEFPDDPDVLLTLRYHRWYLLQFPQAVAAAEMTDPEGESAMRPDSSGVTATKS